MNFFVVLIVNPENIYSAIQWVKSFYMQKNFKTFFCLSSRVCMWSITYKSKSAIVMDIKEISEYLDLVIILELRIDVLSWKRFYWLMTNMYPVNEIFLTFEFGNKYTWKLKKIGFQVWVWNQKLIPMNP